MHLGASGYCSETLTRPVWSVATPIKVRARLRIVLADDQPTILRMVRMILGDHPHLEVVGEAPDGAQAVSMVALLKPDVVVLNIVMPKMSGFEAARRIHAQSPTVSIVILSTHKDAQFIVTARECGATGYVEKQYAGTELVNAIDDTARGKAFFLQ
jgi:two-component system, NarL family, nitrate/nitrite response regulator NarL